MFNYSFETFLLTFFPTENYGYLYRTGTYQVDGIDDLQEYNDTCRAMGVMEIPSEWQWRIWQLTAAIMHIGNINFTENAKGYADADPQSVQVFIF